MLLPPSLTARSGPRRSKKQRVWLDLYPFGCTATVFFQIVLSSLHVSFAHVRLMPARAPSSMTSLLIFGIHCISKRSARYDSQTP
ncbi:hypothetical protein P389DRAFT_166477 [Cystobasidium minutum MCA 4210]|uniref:uncharacterized protein n=1 Tax=Cystobasidium minutum MCA 4210 TaxID=1397322 RepID=UPI0034CD5077|eukprot:jgi/Rhomi1/166477/fgenesh1_kg.2_\